MTNKPNFLFVQADQLSARALPAYGNRVAKTPHIDRLAETGVLFENAYCNYPLCAPSRFSMMSGLLASHAGAYDNGAEFPASLPTFIHYLRLLGYQTCLSGKLHNIGQDQLDGFEERLTTDIYPSDFNWTANWDHAASTTGDERLLAAAGEVNGIAHSGIYEQTIQRDYDDEVVATARRKIQALTRSHDSRPFCLFVSFTHPHDPFAVPRRYWDRYRYHEIDMPAIPRLAREELDPHSQRLYDHIGVHDADMSEAQIRIARHAYYGAVSYIDDQLGTLMDALQRAGLADSTVIVFLSDHGEMLGERGLWFKRSFFDSALQVPLIVNAPERLPATRRAGNVSLVDLLPTVIDLADPDRGLASIETVYDGTSLRASCEGGVARATRPVFAELSGEGLEAPAVMIMQGAHKYIHCDTDPPQLYDRSRDPLEQHNLAGNPELSEIERKLASAVAANWNLDELRRRVIESQRCRRIVDRAHALGQSPSWDYDTDTPGAEQYFRPCPANPSASNYNDRFEVRARPDSEEPNVRAGP